MGRYDNEYNEEEVYYCKHCGSLAIIKDEYGYYCNVCSNADLDTTTIQHWELNYYRKNGRYYI